MDNFLACGKLWSYAESIHKLSTSGSVEVIHRVDGILWVVKRQKEEEVTYPVCCFFFYVFVVSDDELKTCNDRSKDYNQRLTRGALPK